MRQCPRFPSSWLRSLWCMLVGSVATVTVYALFLQVSPTLWTTLRFAASPASAGLTTEALQALLPKWWTESWSRSSAAGQLFHFTGDKPLFPPCKEAQSNKKNTYDFIERPKYLRPSTCKNPCWYEDHPRTGSKELRCVPYFYLAGVAKCGTTDLAKRLRLHPEVSPGTEKEYHWWERFRYGKYDPQDSSKESSDTEAMSFEEYTEKIAGRGIVTVHSDIRHLGMSSRIFGDYSPSYLWDPQNWKKLEGNHGCQEPRVIVAHHIRHLYPQAKIILTFRHPTPRLYSRFVSRTFRTPDLKGATAEDFHKLVLQGVQGFKKCFRQWSIRHCAYNDTLYKETPVRLVEGMYPVFMADWLRVWPRKQMLLLRYEDYGGHEKERLEQVFDFLGLSPLNKTAMEKMLHFHPVNQNSYKKIGPMLEKTKKILDDFYQPFIEQFAQLVGEERFRWKDVDQ